MLLELGKIYGYETSAAINDAKKKFMNMPIEEVTTIKEFQRNVESQGRIINHNGI